MAKEGKMKIFRKMQYRDRRYEPSNRDLSNIESLMTLLIGFENQNEFFETEVITSPVHKLDGVEEFRMTFITRKKKPFDMQPMTQHISCLYKSLVEDGFDKETALRRAFYFTVKDNIQGKEEDVKSVTDKLFRQFQDDYAKKIDGKWQQMLYRSKLWITDKAILAMCKTYSLYAITIYLGLRLVLSVLPDFGRYAPGILGITMLITLPLFLLITFVNNKDIVETWKYFYDRSDS